MITIANIAYVFDLLEGMGLRVPPFVADKPEAAARAYQVAFTGLTYDELMAAVDAFVRTGSDFWPTAPKLRSLVPKVALAHQDASEDGFGIFWRLLSSRGAVALGSDRAQGKPWHRDPDIDRRLKHAAEALGGPNSWRVLKVDDIGMHRASFRRAYQAVAAHEQTTGQPKALPEGAGQNVLLFPVGGEG